MEDKMIKCLTSLPSEDGNFKSSLKKATEQQIKSAITIMHFRQSHDKSRIAACDRELKKRSKSKNKGIRYCDITVNKAQREHLKEKGYFVYDLRNSDTDKGYSVEEHVLVDNIGSIVTDTDLIPYMTDGYFINDDDFVKIAEYATKNFSDAINKLVV